MDLKSYHNKNIGSFVSIPLSLVDMMSPVDTIYMATHFNKLSKKIISRVRSSKHYASTMSSWENKLKKVDKNNLAKVAKALGINLEVYNPMAKDSKTSFSGGSRARRSAQILRVKDGVYKPMMAGAVTRGSYQQGMAQMGDSEASFRENRARRQKFIRVMKNENSTREEIRDAVEDPKILIDAWNEILPNPQSENTLILRLGEIVLDDNGRIRDDFFEEVKKCPIVEDDPKPTKIKDIEYSNYPTCPINYEGIGFSTEEDETKWTGEYYYYMKRSQTKSNQYNKTCFNKSSYDLNPNKEQSPLTREPMVSIFKLVTELVKSSNVPGKVKEHLRNLYANMDLGEGHEEFKEWLMENFRIYDSNDDQIDEYDENDEFHNFRLRDVYALRPPEGNGEGITEIPPEIVHMTNLKRIELYHHRNLTELPEELSDLRNLEELGIYNCKISKEGLRPIFALRNLKKLKLGEMSQEFNEQFGDYSSYWEALPFSRSFPFLEELELERNGLQSIPISVCECTSIIKLHLQYNRIKDIFDDISRMTQLKELNLNGNSLITINSKIGELQELESLYLGDMISLQYLPSSLGNLNSLRNLNLAGSYRIFEWCIHGTLNSYLRQNANVEGLRQIKQELSKNQTGVDKKPHPMSILKKLHRLEDLYLGKSPNSPAIHFLHTKCFHDPIIPAEIGDLVSLKALYLHGLRIRELPPEIGKLTSLEILFLDENQLKEIPYEMLELHNLKYLSLKDNKKSFRVIDENRNIIYNNHSLRRDGEYFRYWEENDDLSETQTYLRALLNPEAYMRERLEKLAGFFGYRIKQWNAGSNSTGRRRHRNIGMYNVPVGIDIRLENDPNIDWLEYMNHPEYNAEFDPEYDDDEPSVSTQSESESAQSDSEEAQSDSEEGESERDGRVERRNRIRSRDEEENDVDDQPINRRRRFGGGSRCATVSKMRSKMRDLRL